MPVEAQDDKFLISEQRLIYLMLSDKHSIEDVLDSRMSVEIFSERHRFLVECIFKEYLDNKATFSRLLTRDTYSKYLKNKYKAGQILTHLKTYDTCLLKVSASINDIAALKQDVLDGFAGRQTAIALDTFEQSRKKSGYFSASQQLSDSLNFISSYTGGNRSYFFSLKNEKDEYFLEKKQQRENPATLIKCGISAFDEAMVGGLAPQTLTMIVADSGGGKTTCMLSMAIKIVKSGHDILFVSLEMNKTRLIDRILSNIIDTDFGKISQPDSMKPKEYEEFEKKSRECMDSLAGNFIIMEASEWVSVSSLRREIEIRALAYKPKVVFVDYIGMLKPENKYKDRHDLELGEISKGLRFLGKKYGFATVSACQLNREAIRRMRKNKEDLAGTEDLRGSGELSNDSDFIFALFPTGEGNTLKGQTIKSRYGKSHGTFSLNFDGSRCRVEDIGYPGIVSNSTKNTDKDIDALEALDKDFSSISLKEPQSLDD